MADNLSCSYVTYIESSPEKVWNAFTDADLTAEFWGHSNVSDWQVGSTWEHRRGAPTGPLDGTGTVLESVPPQRLVLTFPTDEPSKVTFDIASHGDVVRLTITHEELADQDICDLVANVWPAIAANLKSLLETGHVLPRSPLEMMPA